MSVEPWIDACPRNAMMPPPGRPDVAEEELQDRRGADDLHAGGVLRPADGVADRGGLVAARGAGEDIGDFEEALARDAARTLDELRRVAREMALEHLIDAARMLQRAVLHRLVEGLRFAAAVLLLSAALRLHARRRLVLLRGAGVEPRLRVVLLPVPSAEQPAELLGVLEVIAEDRRRVRVVDDVVAEVALVGEDVVDHRAEEEGVAAGAEREPVVGHGRGAAEARIDVDDLRAVLLTRLDDPLEADRMVLGHRRAHDENRVGVGEVLLRGGGAAAAERGDQPGHRGAVSYPRLVGEADHAQAGCEELLDEVVLFDVERGAAEVGDAGGVVVAVVEGALAQCPHPLGDHLQRLLDGELEPLARARRTVAGAREAPRMRDELEAVGALRAEVAARDRRLRITLDGDELAVAMKDELPAADAAVRTDGARDLRVFILRPQRRGAFAHGLDAGAVAAGFQLADERPFEKELGEHGGNVSKNLARRSGRWRRRGRRLRQNCARPRVWRG